MEKIKKMFLRRKVSLIIKIFFFLLLFNNLSLKAIDNSEYTNITQQNRAIKGTVVDEQGIPLPGVTIVVEGTSRGVITDIDGSYTIDVKATDKLVFSFVGLDTQIIEVGDKVALNVTLTEKVDELEEVTIVAFGKQKKESIVSSITTVNPRELKVPSSNFTTALSGRIPGMVSYQRSGEPGEDDLSFFIRGVTTFGYTATPLILIDGVEMTSTDLARMQPDDIASFSILKDASATSLYGARGANGVIMVSTKEGKEGKANVSVRYEKSISSPTRNLEIADPVSYMKLHNEAITTRDPLGETLYSLEKIEKTAAGENPLLYPAINWHNMLFKDNTVNDRLNLNISGGGKIARYYVAATFNQDNGILKVDSKNNFNSNIDLKKYLLRSNINIHVTPSTEIITRLHATFDDYTGPLDGATTLFNDVIHANPALFQPYYLPDEQNKHKKHIFFGNYDAGGYNNPYANLMRGYKEYTRTMVLSQFELKQNLDFLLKGLNIRGMYSNTNNSYYDVQRFYNPFYYTLGGYDEITEEYTLFPLNEETGTDYLSYNEGQKQVSSNTYFETAAYYDQEFNGLHNVGGLMVFHMRNERIGNAGNLQNSLAFRNMGLAGRFTYGYDKRYFIETNFGYNGSERFAKKNRFGFFPSFGLAWNVSNEPFWNRDIENIIPKLRFKVTTGLVGNDAIGSSADRFFYLSQVNMNDANKRYIFGLDFQEIKNGITVQRYANSDITWEIAEKSNFGMEVNLFNAIDINAEVYKENRTNILMTRAYMPTTMGLDPSASPRANVGQASSHGFDGSIDIQKSFNSDTWITGRFNFTYATSQYKVYEEPDYSKTPWRSRIGYSIGQRWGYVAERLFVDENEILNSPTQMADAMAGDIKYKDINNDGVINELDMVPIGFPVTPEIIYGFGLSFGYKIADISFFFQGLARESFWINYDNTAPFINQTALLKVYQDSHWSENNRDLYAIWPRLSDKLVSNNRLTSTWFMRDGSFLRLKSVEMGLSVPQKHIKRIGLTNLRVYFSGINLLTFSGFKLWDPEMAGEGLGYPVQKVLNFGLQVSF
ncbi:SusC/RagA family TonB-linked outer membrane protein [Petrimonas sp.]|uniref:SusC/RagA family TonB-linked outer membrane protein n=1 Tax=Petrimonas sp. TaxID=2023866 RepID=UPI002FC5A749